MASKQSTTQFALVYSASKKPSSRHLDKRCWKTVEYRQATAEEMKALPVCQHCARRAERDTLQAQQQEKPKREPVARHEPPRRPKDAEKASVTA